VSLVRGDDEFPSETRGRCYPDAPGEVAQLAEHATENRGVGSSILPLATNDFPAFEAR
jgi:hypothetical protein